MGCQLKQILFKFCILHNLHFRVLNVFSSKVDSYFEARAKLSADLFIKKNSFASDPSSHPDYKSVWTKFYQRKQIKAKKPLSVEDLQTGNLIWFVHRGLVIGPMHRPDIEYVLPYSLSGQNVQLL